MKNVQMLLSIYFLFSFISVMGSAQAATSATTDIVPDDIVALYAAQYPQYPEVFVRAGCLEIMRKHGVKYLAEQGAKDTTCFTNKKQCKSDVFISIGKCCQRLGGVYLNNPCFKGRYTNQEVFAGLGSVVRDGYVTAERLLDEYIADGKTLTLNYDNQIFTDAIRGTLGYAIYAYCEQLRIGHLFKTIMKRSINKERIDLIAQNYKNDKGFCKDVCERWGKGRLETVVVDLLAKIFVAVNLQDNYRNEDAGALIGVKIYNFFMDTLNVNCFDDVGYKNFVVDVILKLSSDVRFVESMYAEKSIGHRVQSVCLRHLVHDGYAETLQKRWDETVGLAIKREHDMQCKKLLHCYSQDERATLLDKECHDEMDKLFAQKSKATLTAMQHILTVRAKQACEEVQHDKVQLYDQSAQATLLLQERDRDMVQLFVQKSKIALSAMQRALTMNAQQAFQEVQNLKEEVYAQKAHDMLAAREKLQADAQEWKHGVGQLEKQYDECAQNVQNGLQMMQQETRYVSRLRSLGADYLGQKTKLLLSYVEHRRRVTIEQAQDQLFQTNSIAWQEICKKLESERHEREQQLLQRNEVPEQAVSPAVQAGQSTTVACMPAVLVGRKNNPYGGSMIALRDRLTVQLLNQQWTDSYGDDFMQRSMSSSQNVSTMVLPTYYGQHLLPVVMPFMIQQGLHVYHQ